MAPSRPFAFGIYRLLEGRDAYLICSQRKSPIILRGCLKEVELSCYGEYFLEFANY